MSFLGLNLHVQKPGLGIGSFDLSLKIAHFKERPWAIQSRRSLQKSDMSWSLSLLFKKSDVSDSFVIRAKSSQKGVIRSKNLYFRIFRNSISDFFSPYYAQDRIALSITNNEQIAWKTNERIPNPDKYSSGHRYSYLNAVLHL